MAAQAEGSVTGEQHLDEEEEAAAVTDYGRGINVDSSVVAKGEAADIDNPAPEEQANDDAATPTWDFFKADTRESQEHSTMKSLTQELPTTVRSIEAKKQKAAKAKDPMPEVPDTAGLNELAASHSLDTPASPPTPAARTRKTRLRQDVLWAGEVIQSMRLSKAKPTSPKKKQK